MKPDFRIYKIDETEHWCEDTLSKAGTIFGVYLFDANRHVHCCELTPSYEMECLGSTWTGNPEVDLDEQEREDLAEEIREADADCDDFRYVHVRRVDLSKCKAIETDDKVWADLLEDANGNEDEAWKQALSQAAEYCTGNGYTG